MAGWGGMGIGLHWGGIVRTDHCYRGEGSGGEGGGEEGDGSGAPLWTGHCHRGSGGVKGVGLSFGG